jgi:AraC-like DNA-binding protein
MKPTVRICRLNSPGLEILHVEHATAVIPTHVHASWCVLVMEEGERSLTVADRQYRLQPGDAVIIPEHTAHSCAGAPDGCSFWAVNFTLAGLEAVHAREYAKQGFLRVRGDNLSRLLHAVLDGKGGPETAGELLLALRALRPAASPSVEDGPVCPACEAANPAVLLARTILDGPEGLETPLAELARRCGTSRFHLCRLFKRETGISPNEYKTLSRLRQARMLLSRGAPLADAAAGSGFHDQSHLTLRFKKYMGMPPGAFARACQ